MSCHLPPSTSTHPLLPPPLQEVKALLDQGVFDMQQLADGGWVTALKYEDEILEELQALTGGKKDEVRTRWGWDWEGGLRGGVLGRHVGQLEVGGEGEAVVAWVGHWGGTAVPTGGGGLQVLACSC